jgi:hypothetical protein
MLKTEIQRKGEGVIPDMSFLPRVTAATREKVSREFDDLGPSACTKKVVRFLRRSNPELLDIASKCARDVGPPGTTMTGFAMFLRLVIVESLAAGVVLEPDSLPRVAPETRDRLVETIDRQGEEAFTMEALDHLERSNPELLQMAHAFASRHSDYLRLMQGFALLYRSLSLQQSADRVGFH